MKNKNKETIVCLVGPTASGKTEIALRLAKRLNAEIISCDSMQVYKGADIASGKPTKEQKKAIRHHLIDILDPSQEYNAARFGKAAQKIIQATHRKGKGVIIVAGTGLYLRALLDGIFVGPAQNIKLRKKLSAQAQRYGVDHLYARLKRLDPKAASTIHPHDLRRLIRALEVYQLSGVAISNLQKTAQGIRDQYAVYIFGLIRKRDQLYQRIGNRVEQMFRRGLVKEIEKLKKRRLSKTIKALLGYKEILGFLQGEYSLNEAKERLKQNTRRYAKRQLTWFRKEKGIHWVEAGSQDSPQTVAEKILEKYVGYRKR